MGSLFPPSIVVLVLASLLCGRSFAFQTAPLASQRQQGATSNGLAGKTAIPFGIFVVPDNSDPDHDNRQEPQQEHQPPEQQQQSRTQPVRSRLQRFRKRLSRVVRKNLAVAAFVGAATGGLWQVATPQRADASAPVMALPKQQARDPVEDALADRDRQLQQEWQNEMNYRNNKAREIEAKHGVAAREKYEAEWEEEVARKHKEKQEGLVQLKRDLLDQGIDFNTDYEGKRQVMLYEKGIDLGEIPGTPFYMEKQMEKKNFKKSRAAKIQYNRRVIKAMVQDMKNRDIDPLEYFEQHKDRAQQILAMKPLEAAQLAQKYEANLEQYGQINVPEEGEQSALEKMKNKKTTKTDGGEDKAAKQKAKEEAKRVKAEAKAKLKEEKEKAKEEAKAKKVAAKKARDEAKAAAASAAAPAQAVAESGVMDSETASGEDGTVSEPEGSEKRGDDGMEGSEETTAVTASSDTSSKSLLSKKVSIGGKQIGVLPLAGGTVVALGGGGVGLKFYQERAAAAEEERQRQFRLLMGEADGPKKKKGPSPGPAPALEVMDTQDEDDEDEDEDSMDVKFDEEQHRESEDEEDSEPSPAPASEAPKKKRRMGGFFSKKSKNARETDLNNLVSSDATAPQFASLLAKILTYGAPGRFPSVDKLPGKMPFDDFDLEVAKQELIDAREEAGVSMEESAEIFANVVNCMLIDIVDLASSTLKEKDEKATLNGISVVVDFMNHAASLYDSVAEGVTITPVTYQGSLGKGKLEQMYQAYAVSGMMNMANMDGDFDSRVRLLQDVFEIPEKKAEGLAMKAMQKNMMKMMKDGEGMEGLEEMMKGMGGMEGMEGLMGGGADGGDMDPEQLKEMLLALKEMKNSGTIPAKEFEGVKEEFKKAFGSSIDDVIKEGDANSSEFDAQDKELLDLMKEILYD